MTRRRLARLLIPVAILLPILAACRPEEIALVRANYRPPARAANCHGAVDELWPASSRAWAHRIVQRESGGNPAAQNRSSTAAGCFQLLRMHADLFVAVGYSWADRYNARANTLAALRLFKGSGASPWGG